jgi:hypothetical protein
MSVLRQAELSKGFVPAPVVPLCVIYWWLVHTFFRLTKFYGDFIVPGGRFGLIKGSIGQPH